MLTLNLYLLEKFKSLEKLGNLEKTWKMFISDMKMACWKTRLCVATKMAIFDFLLYF